MSVFSQHWNCCRNYYHYFVQIVETEAAQHRGKGKIFLNRFREAMVSTIEKRLQQQFKENTKTAHEATTSRTALSLASEYKIELEAYVKLVYPRVKSGRRSASWADTKATQAGKSAVSHASIAKHIVPASRRLKRDSR
ncbi:MAG: hypothetical protein MH252_06960 [Thermosynechococcaceae cyanobacterium MS004]|nr:hypothetical protein [Thermosynechococcaceae cyanobacterium MS004]